MKLLLHTCCGPCLFYVGRALKKENIEFECYFYNPNIHPFPEHEKRLESFKKHVSTEGYRYHIEPGWDAFEWIRRTAPFLAGDGKEKRCLECYRMRFEKTARFAVDLGFDTISTTLLVSPYQPAELLRQALEEAADMFGLVPLTKDFRDGYREGRRLAREAGLYMQKYCGCMLSEYETLELKKESKK